MIPARNNRRWRSFCRNEPINRIADKDRRLGTFRDSDTQPFRVFRLRQPSNRERLNNITFALTRFFNRPDPAFNSVGSFSLRQARRLRSRAMPDPSAYSEGQHEKDPDTAQTDNGSMPQPQKSHSQNGAETVSYTHLTLPTKA